MEDENNSTRRAVLKSALATTALAGSAGIGAAQPGNGNGRGQGQRPPTVSWTHDWVEADGPSHPYFGSPLALIVELELAKPVGPVLAEFGLNFGHENLRLMSTTIQATPDGSGTTVSGRSYPINYELTRTLPSEPTLLNVERAAGSGQNLDVHLVESWEMEGQPIDDEHDEVAIEMTLSEPVGAFDVTFDYWRVKSWDGPTPGKVTVHMTPDGDGGRRVSGTGDRIPSGFIEHAAWLLIDLSKPGAR